MHESKILGLLTQNSGTASQWCECEYLKLEVLRMQVLRTETNDNTDMDPFYFFPERSDILAKLNQTAVRINPSYSVCFLRYEHQGISANVFFPLSVQ